MIARACVNSCMMKFLKGAEKIAGASCEPGHASAHLHKHNISGGCAGADEVKLLAARYGKPKIFSSWVELVRYAATAADAVVPQFTSCIERRVIARNYSPTARSGSKVRWSCATLGTELIPNFIASLLRGVAVTR